LPFTGGKHLKYATLFSRLAIYHSIFQSVMSFFRKLSDLTLKPWYAGTLAAVGLLIPMIGAAQRHQIVQYFPFNLRFPKWMSDLFPSSWRSALGEFLSSLPWPEATAWVCFWLLGALWIGMYYLRQKRRGVEVQKLHDAVETLQRMPDQEFLDIYRRGVTEMHERLYLLNGAPRPSDKRPSNEDLESAIRATLQVIAKLTRAFDPEPSGRYGARVMVYVAFDKPTTFHDIAPDFRERVRFGSRFVTIQGLLVARRVLSSTASASGADEKIDEVVLLVPESPRATHNHDIIFGAPRAACQEYDRMESMAKAYYIPDMRRLAVPEDEQREREEYYSPAGPGASIRSALAFPLIVRKTADDGSLTLPLIATLNVYCDKPDMLGTDQFPDRRSEVLGQLLLPFLEPLAGTIEEWLED